MTKPTTRFALLAAGLIAVAGAHAQTAPAAGSSDLPPKAGEPSTQTHGVPNLATTNSPATEAPILNKDQVRQDAHGMGAAAATTPVPGKAGEMSTMAQGRPNAIVNEQTGPRSRQEVVGELLQRRSLYEAARRNAQAMGYTGAVVPQ